MSDPPTNHDKSHQIDFDVTKPPKDIRFVGLLDNPGGSGNKLNGLFDWRCEGCDTWGRDVTLVESEQAFLARWSCNRCAETTVVRFRGRASAEWIAAHALAVTGSALCHLADADFGATVSNTTDGKNGQRLFAWIAVPALIVLVALGLSDIRRPAESSAAHTWISQEIRYSAALSRLLGNWASEDGKDLLCFVYIDGNSLTGSYVHFSGGRLPGRRVRFDVLHEDPAGERLVIRHLSEESDEAKGELSGATGGPDATIYIPLHGRSLTWIDIEDGKPVLKVHHRVDSVPAHLSQSI